MNFTYGPGAGGPGIMQASSLNNQALAKSQAGDHAGAEVLHQQALQLKIASAGANSLQAALSYNALGETQLKLGKLEEAEENLLRAVQIRESTPGNAFDAAVSRESLAQVYEAKGEWDQARQTRLKVPNQMVCSNYKCPNQMFTMEQLRQCMKCKAAYYCGQNCQREDWRTRHRALCQAFEAQT